MYNLSTAAFLDSQTKVLYTNTYTHMYERYSNRGGQRQIFYAHFVPSCPPQAIPVWTNICTVCYMCVLQLCCDLGRCELLRKGYFDGRQKEVCLQSLFKFQY
jgi:hypothetical protein